VTRLPDRVRGARRAALTPADPWLLFGYPGMSFGRPAEPDKIFRHSVRHFDHVHDAAKRFVIAAALADHLSAADSVI
jgi:hypothetical protein